MPRANKFLGLCLAASLLVIAACQSAATPIPTPTTPPLAKELTLYNWADYMPDAVLEAFKKEFGVTVNYIPYDTQENAVQNMRDGKVYDLVVVDNSFIPVLAAEKLIAEIDYRNIPNFKNVSPNFRDMAYDPGNKHAIPYHWGTTGLLVRTDLVKKPVTKWSDMIDPAYKGKVGLWGIPREIISIALKSVGHSVNSEDPKALEEARQWMYKLKANSFMMDIYSDTSAPLLADGTAVIALGWSYDLLKAKELNPNIVYILPEEGSVLWGDDFVIPANSPNKYTAEVFLNFLLRPDISAQIINESYYAMPNDAALPLVKPEIAQDAAIFPPNSVLKTAEIDLPLTAQGLKQNEELWRRFLADEF